jgi:hypothetical protein
MATSEPAERRPSPEWVQATAWTGEEWCRRAIGRQKRGRSVPKQEIVGKLRIRNCELLEFVVDSSWGIMLFRNTRREKQTEIATPPQSFR